MQGNFFWVADNYPNSSKLMLLFYTHKRKQLFLNVKNCDIQKQFGRRLLLGFCM